MFQTVSQQFQSLCRRCFTFSAANNINLSATNLNSHLSETNAWAKQSKMTFNPDHNKQAHKIIFLIK